MYAQCVTNAQGCSSESLQICPSPNFNQTSSSSFSEGTRVALISNHFNSLDSNPSSLSVKSSISPISKNIFKSVHSIVTLLTPKHFTYPLQEDVMRIPAFCILFSTDRKSTRLNS